MAHHLDNLRQKAHELALTDDSRLPKRMVSLEMREFSARMDRISRFITSLQDANGGCSQPAEEWLLDHAGFLAKQELFIRESLHAKWRRRLPHSRKARVPRLLILCREYVELTDGELNEQSLAEYLNSYQEIAVLTHAEVWALPIYMRMALIYKLADIVELMSERRTICAQVEQILSRVKPLVPDPAALTEALDKAGWELPLSGPMIVHLVSHLREWEDDPSAVRQWLLCQLDNGVESLEQIQTYEYQLQAAYQVQTGNLINSLHSMDRWNWQTFCESVSLIEQALLKEETGLYGQLDDTSRHYLRLRVERLARRFRVPEVRVAEMAVELADSEYRSGKQASADSSDGLERRAFVAYYLTEAAGMRQLQKALLACGSMKRRPLPEMKLRGKGGYFIRLGLFYAALLSLLAWWLAPRESPTVTDLLWILLALLVPVSEWAVAFVHWWIERRYKPMPILRYDFSRGIPDEAATMVIVPVIWSSVDDVGESVDRLEMHYLANRDPNLRFAILGDLADAKEERLPGDEAIIGEAKRRVEALNAKYAHNGARSGPFLYIQRRRCYNPSEGVWMGWERKRGKLVEFVELLQGKEGTTCEVLVGDPGCFPNIRYIITLDSDTQLPIGSANRLVAAMHFPYNRPRLNATRTRVVEGYGMLQPSVATSYAGATRTRLTALWSGNPGMDPYAFAISDPYQDSLGEGIFTGKGIFDVRVFSEILCERIPDNRVLSHDLLEGGFVRVGLISDVELLDEMPETFSAMQMRLHRWVRGDWQLLGWLLPKACNRRGQKVPVDLSALTRWQIVDNLRRSLVMPSLFVLIAPGLLLLPGSGIRWLAFVLLTAALPIVRHSLIPGQWNRNAKGIWRTVHIAAMQFATLPYQTVMLLDAIVRTLYRLFISKRRLLEWVPSSHLVRRNRNGRLPLIWKWPQGFGLIVFAGLTFMLANDPAVRWGGLAIACLWLLAPAWIRWLNSPIAERKRDLPEQDKQKLRAVAEDIWRFFEDYVTEDNHWLPPDNVQIHPPNGVARRTSPTNIGLYLVSVLAARDFGFIDTPGMVARLSRTLDTIERLDKWKGHLYNWVDTATLQPMLPKYVSTVDSGNLVVSLITVKEGLTEWLEREEEASGPVWKTDGVPDWAEAGRQLVDRMERLILDTDFVSLFDFRHRLFSLGFNETDNRLDPVLYDLLASEARQASFIAIALGQIPVTHWQRLGRSMTKIGRRTALLSWSGTMFEYLMPFLFMRTYPNTLWSETCQAVVNRQIEYGLQRNVPFGVSESGYYAFDHQLNYQYRAFGVPGLGFQRGLEQELVVAPYAAILALPFSPDRGMDNLLHYERIGAKGTYGYYEAVDYTASRMPKGSKYKVIQSYMSHHQGMSLLALANLLNPVPITERFHRDKRVQAAEPLLQERQPVRPKLIHQPAVIRSLPDASDRDLQAGGVREAAFRDRPAGKLEAGLLSNGKLTTMVTDSGSGFIRYGELAVTRWRPDPVFEPWGNFVYVRDVTRDKVWSPSFQPVGAPGQYRVHFGLERVTYSREDDRIRTLMEVCVAPEQQADIRRITLSNLDSETRIIEVTTYAEIVLAPENADHAHPAFNKLFVETSYSEETECLLARRRPRHDKEKPIWAAHALMVDGITPEPPEVETDRAEFIGRGHTPSNPRMLRAKLRGTTGAVVDPVFVMRRRITLEPGAQVKLMAVTCVGDSKTEVLEMARHFGSNTAVERAVQLAWTRQQIELRHLGLTAADATAFQRLAGRLLVRPVPAREQAEGLLLNRKGQSGLWPYGLSGDKPILLVRTGKSPNMKRVGTLIKGYEYLRRLGLDFDLVLLNESGGSYRQTVQDEIRRVVEDNIRQLEYGLGVFVLDAASLPEEDRALLFAVAHTVLHASGRSLQAQLRSLQPVRQTGLGEERSAEPADRSGGEMPPVAVGAEEPYVPKNGHNLLYYNGWGGFTEDGSEYRMVIKGEHPLPAPWINVLSNPGFGCLISEQGTGYTWWSNSREFKLTPWSNDPVIDRPGEIGYFRDENTGHVWTLFPWGAPPDQAYSVAHGKGYSQFIHARYGIRHEACVYVSADDPVKLIEIRIRNESAAPRNLSFTYYAEWVLGVRREVDAPFVVTEWDESTGTMQAYSTYQDHFRGARAFLGVFTDPDGGKLPRAWTADRREFVGRNGSLAQPDGLKRVKLSGKTGPVGDPCAAVQAAFHLEPGGERTIYVVFGCGESKEAADRLIRKYLDPGVCRKALEQVRQFWSDLLGQIQVFTPNREMDLLLNGWLLYQSLGCRMWARTGFYQAGGAFGFRDQLQDSLVFLHVKPELTRAQLLRHAAHQYVEGDVQHWWHEETGRGIRTRFSDDLLWLPYAVSRYVEHTGDRGVLEERIPYLRSDPLPVDEHERYEETVVSEEQGTLYEHCLRAIDLALSRIGEHGLPHIGIGDWNDGMSSMGDEGRGESVWLAWFLYDNLTRFARLSRDRGDEGRAKRYEEWKERLASAADQHAWDGQWYRRAYTDSGQWFGTIRGNECMIDAIAQSWSVISGAAPKDRALQAMQSFDRELVDRRLHLARLLTPGFDRTEPTPGYIQGYPPGIRENGGQYTHGVIWSIVAWCLLGHGDKAMELFQMLNPVTHTRTANEVHIYKGEPYVMAADVYTAPPHEGRAGWTWYTGAAGWMYQAGVEWILGLRRREGRLYILPCIPDDWPGFAVTYRYGGTVYTIHVTNGRYTGEGEVAAVGQSAEPPGEHANVDEEGKPYIDLVDDGKNRVIRVTIGSPLPSGTGDK